MMSVFNLRKVRESGLTTLGCAKALYFVAMQNPDKKTAMKTFDLYTLQKLERNGYIESQNGGWRATEEGLKTLEWVMKEER